MGTRSHVWDQCDMGKKWTDTIGGALDNRPQCYGSMIDTNQGVHLVGSERYASTTQESQAGIWINKGGLLIIIPWRSIKSRARTWLVVAMRLQTQHSSFRLHTSSNMSSVLTNDAHGSFANSDEEICFPSCNFCLKEHLGEPTQFKIRLPFGRAHQLVRTNPRLGFQHKD
jgi:hypothetical protein